MSYTHYEADSDYSGETLYAKAEPLDTDTWANGIVAMTENGSTGEFSATLDEDTQYVIFSQEGGSPASSDPDVGQVYRLGLGGNTLDRFNLPRN